MSQETRITCPNCGCEIDVNHVIAHQVEEDIRKKYQAHLAKQNRKFQEEADRLSREKADLERQRAEQERQVAEKVGQRVREERATLEKQLRESLQGEQAERMAMIEKELQEKSEQVRELHRTKAEMERIKREKEELRETLEAENARKLNERIAEEKDRIRRAEQERSELVVKELQKQLEDQKRLTEEMKRKQEQGSMQLQGEVQELGIEEWLITHFPLDTVTEIKKGERGADCLQVVNTHSRQGCGTICYESKRTKEFRPAWLEKFRDDLRLKGADIGVLVTDVLPKGMKRMGLVEGIWVCTYDEFKGLCVVLREGLIQLSAAVASQENKGEKMVMLYNFLTGPEFRMQVEAIVEGFTQMQADLEAEKRSIMGHWKKREKQIQKVLLNTNHMYSSIKGIAGAAIQPIQTLELPDPDPVLEDDDLE